MQVAQRGSTFTAPNGAYTLDRYQFYQANGAVFDVKTSTDAPTGFGGSLEVDCTTAAASPTSNSYAQMVQRIEGQDLQGLAYGTSSAKKITLSFWVKSNKTGTYQVNFRKTQSPAQMANKTYTINAADTWEYKSVTVDGATGFSLVTDNTQGLMVDWWYHSGTDYSSGSGSETYIAFSGSNYNNNGTANLGDNTSNYLRMTGVKLEVGSVATEFDHRSYAEELQACQRYYQKNISTSSDTSMSFCRGQAFSTNSAYVYFEHPVEMRTKPSLSNSIASVGNFGALQHNGGGMSISGVSHVSAWSSRWTSTISLTVASGTFTAGQATELDAGGNSGAFLAFDAEL